MSYIKSLKLIQASIVVDLNNFSERNAIKIEKLLKVQKQLNEEFNSVSVDLFLKSFREHKEGILFIFENPNLEKILTNNMFFKRKQKIVFEEENEEIIKIFFKEYLLEDIKSCCDMAFAKEQYGIVDELLQYRLFLPEEVIHLIEKKVNSKAEYILNVADKVLKDSSIFKKSFSLLVKSLNEKEANDKIRKLESLLMSYNKKALSRSGLAHFIYTIFDGLYWIANTPKTIEEKIEKQGVFSDLKLTLGIFGGIFILFISFLFFINRHEKKIESKKKIAQDLRFDKSVYGYLADFDTTKISNIKPIEELSSGPFYTGYFGKKSKPYYLLKNVKVVNKSNYEILILPDKEWYESFGINSHAFYLKPQDSIYADFFFNRIYIGKKLALFKDYNESKLKNSFHRFYYKKKLPRFIELIPSAKKTIKKIFKIKERVEFLEKYGELYLKSEKIFQVDGAYLNSYSFSE